MKRALFVIDVQNEYFTGKLPIKYPQSSFGNILKAIDIARAHGIPVIVIQHSSPEGSATFARGTNGWELHDAIKEKRHDFLIEKTFPGSFTDTKLGEILKELGCDTVVITGYMTQMCCDTTARQAFHSGYNVEFLSDATGAPDVSNYAGSMTAEQLHKAILVTQAMCFSRVMTLEEWGKGL